MTLRPKQSLRTLLGSPSALATLLALAGVTALPAQFSTFFDSVAQFDQSYETWTSQDNGAFSDEQLVRLSGMRAPIQIVLPGLPADADVDAFERQGPDEYYFSLAGWAVLPGGLRVHPGDIVFWNGASYSKAFDLRACGLPAGLNLDALGMVPGLFGGSFFHVSFDTTFSPGGGLTIFDEELVALTPWSCTFGGSAIQLIGSDRRWDLDAWSVISRWGIFFDFLDYVSYDTWVVAGGIVQVPGRALSYRLATSLWSEPFYTVQGEVPFAGLDALWILPAGIFEDGLESGATNRWSEASP